MVWAPRVDRLTDEALLAAVGVGDADAATAFVRRFQRPVYCLALSITLDPSTAEEVAQQAFERAWRHAGAYDARRGRVSTWLLTITRNLAIDTLRVRRAEPLDPDANNDLLPWSTALDPALVAEQTDDLGRLRAALRDLPVEQMRAVLLATLGSRTSTEIAALENVPIPTAKHRIQTGLRKLRQAVRAET